MNLICAASCKPPSTPAWPAWPSVFMHGYRFTEHEVAAKRIATEIGFPQISVSHEVSPLMKLVSRGDTTVVDAYLSPILRRYVEQVAGEMPGVKLFFMQSSGGLTERMHSRARMRSCPARQAASWAWCAQRNWPISTASSASTWAARPPT